MFEELNEHRQAVAENISKAFDSDIEKARSGVYADNAQNRKLNRVGQRYGSEKKDEEPSQKTPKKDDNYASKVEGYASGAKTESLKRAAADENAAPEVRDAAKKELSKRGESESTSTDVKAKKTPAQVKAEKAKRSFIREFMEDGSDKYMDEFIDDNVEYYKEVLDKYGAEDLFDLSEKFSEKYENDPKDPYGYERLSKITVKCVKMIPAEKFPADRKALLQNWYK